MCINACHLDWNNTLQQSCTAQNDLNGNFKIRAIATDVTRNLFMVQDNGKVVAEPERSSTSGNVPAFCNVLLKDAASLLGNFLHLFFAA